MFKFTFRDWLWLMLVLSMGLKWWLSERDLVAKLDQANRLQAARTTLRQDLAAVTPIVWGSSPNYEPDGIAGDWLPDE